MNKRILIEKTGNRTRVAVTCKSDLIEYDESSPQAYIRAKNTIYNAVIKSIRPELGAAFVQYVDNQDGNTKDGFLPFSNISSTYFSKQATSPSESEIGKLIKTGQKILVQIKKDQLHHESKGAALTTFISLAGTYLVLLPLNQKQGISRKADTSQRDLIRETLKNIQVDESMGIIIRTAGISAKPEELEWDYKALLQQWTSIQEAHNSQSAPCLIHEDENIVTRMVRDNMSSKTEKIICNDKDIFNQIQAYLQNIRPEYLDNDILEFYDHELMFDHYSLEEQVESIFHVRTSLPSGGQIVMHGTEAGYMIDVNSSKSTFGSNVEESALNTNKQAAIKIADLLRLRDVSGIIYIDFIDMGNEENRLTIEKLFADRCSLDRANVKHEPISLLTGCMPVLRQGLGTVFFKSSLEPVQHDEAIIIGKRRSVVSYSNYLLCVVEKSATQKTDVIQVQLPVDVATYMLNELRGTIHNIESKHNVTVKIIPNENFTHRRYILKRFHKEESENTIHSHNLIAQAPEEKDWISSPKHQTPHVSRRASPLPRTPNKAGVISSIWESIFGKEKPKRPQSTSRKSSSQRSTRGNRSTSGQRTRRNDSRAPYDSGRKRPERARHAQSSDSTHKHRSESSEEKNFNNMSLDSSSNPVKKYGTRPNRSSHANRRRGPSSPHSRTRKASPRSGNAESADTHISKFDDD